MLADQAELDELIATHSSGWTLDRIAPVERNILRVALHELRSRPDVPAEVAIDEAVEAAKELCSAEAPGFVNGILGTVARQEAALHDGRARLGQRARAGARGGRRTGCARGRSSQEEAAELVERCAELAGRLGAEIDSRARVAGEAEGQERLL